MEIFLFLVGWTLKRVQWKILESSFGFSRIFCSICSVLHLALQDLEAQVYLWTEH